MSHPRFVCVLAVALVLPLGACKPTVPPATPPVPTAAVDLTPPGLSAAPAEGATASAAPQTAPARCPYTGFAAFLQHFGHDIALQERSVADPLETRHVDAGAEPEPATVVRHVALAEVEWPVMPDPATLPHSHRVLETTAQADGGMQVRIRATDTSDQQTYTFRQQPCWQLVRVEDESI